MYPRTLPDGSSRYHTPDSMLFQRNEGESFAIIVTCALRDGFPTSRLPRDAERFRGVRFWWRIDGAEERWRPAGDSLRLSAEHAGGHVVAFNFDASGRDAGPCPICERNGWRGVGGPHEP